MCQQVLGTETARFFLNHARDVDIARRLEPVPYQPRNPIDLGRHRPFDVDGAAAPDLAVVHFAPEGRMGPRIVLTDVDMIEVGVEHQRLGLAPARHVSDRVAGIVDPHVGIAELFHLVAHESSNLALVTRQALRLNQTLKEIDTGLEVTHGLVLQQAGRRAEIQARESLSPNYGVRAFGYVASQRRWLPLKLRRGLTLTATSASPRRPESDHRG